jgi:BirA family biotin operon repressor/biotin-[acetyl-CoA-carboxylase] ligase
VPVCELVFFRCAAGTVGTESGGRRGGSTRTGRLPAGRPRPESQGPIKAVIGVGINIDVSDQLDNELATDLGLQPAGLREFVPSADVSRNVVAANIINQLYAALDEFARTGFASFVDEWKRFDSLRGESVSVQIGARTYEGIASGIADDGALLLRANGKTMNVVSGEVSVRARQMAGSGT